MSQTSNKVFMIGWEYPPHNSGGLGVACDGLTKALYQDETEVHFSLPYESKHSVDHMNIHTCVHENWKQPIFQDTNGNFINTSGQTAPPFLAYSPEFLASTSFEYSSQTQNEYSHNLENWGYSFDLNKLHTQSTSQLERQVAEYAQVVGNIGSKQNLNYEVIHAHDWMSFPAGQELQQKTGKPLIAHVHSTEYDRSGLNQGNKFIEAVEYAGMHRANHVIAVSYYTKRLLEQKYGVDPKKISVVHNGVSSLETPANPGTQHFAPKRPVIAFMGRLTIQKGVSYFLDLAHAVLEKIPNALFVVAGNGDMYHELLLKTASAGISASVVFSGFVRDAQRKKLLDRADVFVMPSLSEPFGLVALEAAQHHTPVIVSKNAGVAEVLPHATVLDFWDIDKMADSITQIITNTILSQQIVQGQLADISQQTWKSSAQKVKHIYRTAFLGSK